MGRKSTRRMQMQIDEIGSIVKAKSLKEALEKFRKYALSYNIDPQDKTIWMLPEHLPRKDDFYITVNKVPLFRDLYQFSVKHFTKEDGFGDVSTTDWKEVPHPKIKGTRAKQYVIQYPCVDEVLAWIEVPKSRYNEKLLITPAIERVKKVRK